jgi:dienelactone hydrolase
MSLRVVVGAFAFSLSVVPLAMAQASKPPITDYPRQGADIVQQLAGGQFGAVEAGFDTQMARDLPQMNLSNQWKELLTQTGPFLKVKGVAVTAESGGYHVVTMTCVFQRVSEANALITFDKEGRIAGLYFGPRPTEAVNQWSTPSYAAVDSFHEVPVTVEDGPWRLPGTLTLPNGKGPFPAVVLVPGSPPMDQDSTMGPNKIFKDLAWGLGSHGIAVLRYTKRTHQFGAGLGGGQISSFTVREELNEDARAALSLLANRSEVNHLQTFLLGHSMGGLVAPQIAADDPQIAGIVAMGAPSGDLLTVLLERVEKSAGPGGEMGKQASAMIPAIKKLRDGDFAPGEIVDLFGQRTPVSYWAELRNYRAGAAAAKLKIPVMIMVAGHDAEVPPDDFESWKSALIEHRNATVKFYPGLFHLFMPSTATQKGADTPADWGRAGHIAPEVVNDISSWILSNGRM